MALADTTRNDLEAQLREAIWTGRLVDRRTGNATADDPAQGADWPAQRTVPAALLAEMLTTTEGSRRPRALRLAGARITGKLHLEATELQALRHLSDVGACVPAASYHCRRGNPDAREPVSPESDEHLPDVNPSTRSPIDR